MKKQRGSAILIAVFLVAAIGGIAFSFGKIFLLEADTATVTENGVSAYYAAESGIEEGLLRYRYNKNSEVPFKSWKLGENKVYRANLSSDNVDTNGVTYDGAPKSNTIATADNASQMYDLRMGFIGTFGKPFYGQDTTGLNVLNDFVFSNIAKYGSTDNYHDYSFLLIPKDETYKINLESLGINQTNLTEKDITLFANFVQSTANVPAVAPSDINSIMYVKFVVDYNGDGTNVKEYKTFITSNPSSCSLLGGTSGCQNDLLIANFLSVGANSGQAWRYNNLIQRFIITKLGAQAILPQSKVTLSLRPLYNDAYIGLSTQKCLVQESCTNADKSVVAPGPFTTITSTGYFDGATRTLEANIDRQSGTLYDLFDYVIFEKQ